MSASQPTIEPARPPPVAKGAPRKRSVWTLPVRGMHCAGCVSRVERALREAGAERADVNLALEQATVSLCEHANARQLVDGLRAAGFNTDIVTVELGVARMSSAACATRIESTLAKLDGVLAVTVNPATERARIQAVAGAFTREQAVRRIRDAGYDVVVDDDNVVAGDDGLHRLAVVARRDRIILWGAVLLTLPFLAQMLLMWVGVGMHMPVWLEFLLAAPVQFVAGWRFHRGAIKALAAWAPNMDVLVSMGTFAAFGYSVALMLRFGEGAAGQLYFEAAVVVITLVLLGKVLEARARHSTATAIRALLALRPREASVWRGESYQLLSLDQVLIGDRVLIRPGETIPVDATLESGASEVDESLVTGESVPVAKHVGDRVLEGSMNGAGSLTVRVDRIGDDTTIARIIAMVEAAQASKAPVQKLVDRVAAVFVPIVILIACATFLLWWLTAGDFESALVASVSVLVVACPCALGLATPAAIVTGTGAAARAGILIKDVQSLEAIARPQIVVFDKTGTLTEGRAEVSAVIPCSDWASDTDALMRLGASAQLHSEHVLAKAMVRYAEERALALVAPNTFKSHTGMGIEARVDAHHVVIGNDRLLSTLGIDKAQHVESEEGGFTELLIAIDGVLAGRVQVLDPIKAGAAEAVQLLKHWGIRTVLLTGDSQSAARRVADVLALDEMRAQVLPEHKRDQIVSLRGEGRRVVMIGDGVNDAPALAEADVGVAMASGADVAVESAGITLMRGDPMLVPSAVSIARATVAKIRQNLFWAFIYNVICIPIAALGWLSPALAGAAMALSSVSVVSNALLLKRWQPIASTMTMAEQERTRDED